MIFDEFEEELGRAAEEGASVMGEMGEEADLAAMWGEGADGGFRVESGDQVVARLPLDSRELPFWAPRGAVNYRGRLDVGTSHY